MPRKPKPDPDGDDARLWQAVTQGVTPMRKREPSATPPPPPEPKPPPKAEKSPKPARAAPAKPPPEPWRPPELPPLAPGQAAGVDKRTAQRLKRGQLAIEATLDLHKHTQAQAREALDAFLAQAQDRGARCVLVITGKGRAGEAGGVLRANVPRWLNQPPNRARVLAIAEAQPKHGGAGALYVLLRRKR